MPPNLFAPTDRTYPAEMDAPTSGGENARSIPAFGKRPPNLTEFFEAQAIFGQCQNLRVLRGMSRQQRTEPNWVGRGAIINTQPIEVASRIRFCILKVVSIR